MHHRHLRARLSVVALLTIAILSQSACGGSSTIRSFRAALAASGPLVRSLAASGAIPESRATAIIKDFDDGAQCALALQSAFSAIPKDDPNATSKKLSAAVTAMRCWRVVVNRQNFATHPRIQQAADIADGILASIVVFYSEPGEMRNEAVSEPSDTVSARNEDDLEKRLKPKVKDLERALKP